MIERGKLRLRNDGSKIWELNGGLHRDLGPAIEWIHDGLSWYQHGRLHRVGGPARIYENGERKYFQNDLLHREDGPAAIFPDGKEEYWIYGKKLLIEEWKSLTAEKNDSK
jgi:hypothetical protein